ncbi:unnamed protein product [Rhizophagus irregularis]|nr:unnamed protein product [Rhizophagus irregularis]CAB4419760.1 unnamed protein product [Rhizophagus irregularis]
MIFNQRLQRLTGITIFTILTKITGLTGNWKDANQNISEFLDDLLNKTKYLLNIWLFFIQIWILCSSYTVQIVGKFGRY